MELAEARALVKDKTDKDTTVRHLVSVEGVMRALARPGRAADVEVG
jgi:predicted hydrolase (HD superfamily)